MKAPEKIYIQSFNVSEEDAKFERLLCFDDIWTEEPEPGQENIEYTRTDSFIEKACNAYCEVCGHYHHTVPYEICRHDCNYYDDFKKHLKGE